MPPLERRETRDDAAAIRRRLLAEIAEQIQVAGSREIRAVHERTLKSVETATDDAILEYAVHMGSVREAGR